MREIADLAESMSESLEKQTAYISRKSVETARSRRDISCKRTEGEGEIGKPDCFRRSDASTSGRSITLIFHQPSWVDERLLAVLGVGYGDDGGKGLRPSALPVVQNGERAQDPLHLIPDAVAGRFEVGNALVQARHPRLHDAVPDSDGAEPQAKA